MSIHDTLATAIRTRRCVLLVAERRRRRVCPHALGYKGKHCKVLVYQFDGDSASGLARAGAWRSFHLDDVTSAELTAGPWHSSPDFIIKAETSFDRIECQATPSHNPQD
jgi:hypothetical protein